MPNDMRRLALAVSLLALLMALPGCANSVSTQLPEIDASARSVMSSAEQERAIKEMLARKDAQQPKTAEEAGKPK